MAISKITSDAIDSTGFTLKAASGNTSLNIQDASGSPNVSLLDSAGTVQWQIFSTMDGAAGLDPLVITSSGGEKVRFQTGGGISFNGDTAAANALSDYEEGTWTASFKGATTDPTVNSVTNSTGAYTKIGDLVFIQYYSGAINISNGGTGSGYIGGLPFSVSDSPTAAVQYSVITFSHTNAFTGQIQNGYTARFYNGFFPILEGSVNGTTWTTGATLYVMASGVYRTDA